MAGNTSNIGFEKQIWDAACVLRGNIDASEYKSVVLGLIFLKYISDRFAAKYKELVEEGDGFEEDQDEYTAENIFFVPENARWSAIAAAAHTPEIGTVIDDAMRSNKEEIALSNLVTIDQLREFEQKIAPLLKEQESDKAPLTIKPELSMREQQLLQFLSVSMGASRNEISEQLGLSGVSTQHLIKRLLEEEKIEACGAPRSRIYKVSRKQ